MADIAGFGRSLAAVPRRVWSPVRLLRQLPLAPVPILATLIVVAVLAGSPVTLSAPAGHPPLRGS